MEDAYSTINIPWRWFSFRPKRVGEKIKNSPYKVDFQVVFTFITHGTINVKTAKSYLQKVSNPRFVALPCHAGVRENTEHLFCEV